MSVGEEDPFISWERTIVGKEEIHGWKRTKKRKQWM